MPDIIDPYAPRYPETTFGPADDRESAFVRLREALAASLAREKRLREALERYGQHDSGCEIHWKGIQFCDCGLRAALAGEEGPPE